MNAQMNLMSVTLGGTFVADAINVGNVSGGLVPVVPTTTTTASTSTSTTSIPRRPPLHLDDQDLFDVTTSTTTSTTPTILHDHDDVHLDDNDFDDEHDHARPPPPRPRRRPPPTTSTLTSTSTSTSTSVSPTTTTLPCNDLSVTSIRFTPKKGSSTTGRLVISGVLDNSGWADVDPRQDDVHIGIQTGGETSCCTVDSQFWTKNFPGALRLLRPEAEHLSAARLRVARGAPHGQRWLQDHRARRRPDRGGTEGHPDRRRDRGDLLGGQAVADQSAAEGPRAGVSVGDRTALP